MSFAKDAISYAYEATRPFSLKQCVCDIAPDGKYTERRAKLAAGALVGHPNVYGDRSKRYVPRHSLFAGARFRVCPRLAEIDDGILYPGHRFIPFCHPNMPIDELTLLDQRGEPIVYRVVDAAIDDVRTYHSLMCLPDIPFLVPDEENAPLERAWLHALDMATWYAKHEFQEGDTIVVTVEDLNQGIYGIEHEPFEEFQRHFAEVRRSDAALEDALLSVVEHASANATVETQLFHAYAQVDPWTLLHPGRHIGAVLEGNDKLVLTNDGHVCYLHAPDADPYARVLEEAADATPEPTGKGKSVAAIINDLGISAAMPEIRAMMREAVADTKGRGADARDKARDEVLADLFPYGPDSFVTVRTGTWLTL